MIPVACVACGGALQPRHPSVIDPQGGGTFSILACTGCGLGCTSPVPDDLAPHYAGDYYGGRHGVAGRWAVRRRLAILRQASGGAPPGSLLDVGCGDGSFLLGAWAAGHQVSGVELEPRRARAAGLEVHAAVEGAEGRGPFHAITLWHSLEHLTDPPATLARLGRLLASGGVLIVAVPDAGSIQARLFGRFWLHLDVPRHLFHFDGRSLDATLARAGLQPVRRWHQEFEYDLIGWVQSALNALSVSPNFLLKRLTGRRPPAHAFDWLTTLALAPPLGIAGIPATWLSTAAGRGGTLLVAAQPLGTKSHGA